MDRSPAPFWIALGLLASALAIVRLSPPGREAALPAPLATFPLTLGEWREGGQGGLDPPARPRTASDMLFRTYANGKGQSVSLYLVYWNRQTEGEVAYTARHASPGQAWAFVREDLARALGPTWLGPELRMTRTLYERRGEAQLVTYWFIQPGRRAIGSRYWGRAYLLWDRLTGSRSDVALVRVATRADRSAPWSGFGVHQGFIREAVPALERYFAG